MGLYFKKTSGLIDNKRMKEIYHVTLSSKLKIRLNFLPESSSMGVFGYLITLIFEIHLLLSDIIIL